MGRTHQDRQAGASALEFALVLPVFLLFFYGLVQYGLVFVLSIGFTAAASDAARSAVSVDPEEDDYESLVIERARAVAVARLSWLPEAAREAVLGTDGQNVELRFESDATLGTVVEVVVRYPDYADAPLAPVFTLPVFGEVPPLPQELRATARNPL
jgi:Flp pilus assembly protein TadG